MAIREYKNKANIHYHSTYHINFCCPCCTDSSHGIDGVLAPGNFGGAVCWCDRDLAGIEQRWREAMKVLFRTV